MKLFIVAITLSGLKLGLKVSLINVATPLITQHLGKKVQRHFILKERVLRAIPCQNIQIDILNHPSY